MKNEHDETNEWDDASPLGTNASFLNPDHAPTTPVMPDLVWANLERALFNEQVAREASGSTNVIGLESRRRSKRGWLAGSVAAGVALVGVGVVVQSVQSSNPPVTVASNQVARNAGGALPVKQILASGTDYQPTTLTSQVKSLVNGMPGMKQMMQAAPATAMPMTPMVAELGTPDGLANCIHALAHDENISALVVDMATFHGTAAGIVVIPLTLTEATATAPAMLHAWVVGPHCSATNPDILQEFTFAVPRSDASGE